MLSTILQAGFLLLLGRLFISSLCGALIGFIASKLMHTGSSFLKCLLLGIGGSIIGNIVSGILGCGAFISYLLSIGGACLLIAIFKNT